MGKSNWTKVALCASTALVALSGTSFAQSQGSEQSAAVSDGAEEIVVTAQRRSESLQKTSLAIDVLSAESIQRAGLTQPTELGSLLPGVQVSQGGAAFQIYVRGVGAFTSTPLSDSAVSQNMDGVSAATTQSVAGSLFDLERIELLKGPQGTLYGRNSSGGALNILPVAPQLGELGGYLVLDRQNYDGTTVEGAVNVPLGEQAAARVSMQVTDRDGYLDDGTNDDQHESVRAQLLVEPNDDLSIRLFGAYQHIGGRGVGYALFEQNPTAFGGAIVPSDRWTSALPELNNRLAKLNLLLTNGASSTALFSPFNPSNINQDNTFWSLHAQIDLDLDFATLTLIPSYQDAEMDYWVIPALNYSSNVPGDGPDFSHATSFEARLGNGTETLKWVVGAFYFNNDQNANQAVNFGPAVNQAFTGDLNTRSYAAFGETTVSLTDTFRVIAGLRYTDETKTVDAFQFNAYPSLACRTPSTGPAGACQVLAVNGEYGAERTNYRTGFEWDVGSHNMLFFTVATGFKSGGQTVSAFPPYDPETVTAYTLGSRNRFFNNVLQLNLEAFHWQYENKQENIAQPDGRGNIVQSLINAGAATSQGVSADLTYHPTANGTFHTAVEYVDATYDSFGYTAYAKVSSGCTPYPGSAPYTVDCSGYQLARTPMWSGAVDYTHDIDLSNGGVISLTGSMTFASERWLEVAFVPNDRAPAYTVWNANAAYIAPGDAFRLEAYVRNIGDEAVYTGAQQSPMIDGFIAANINPPRTYGARLRVNF